jgi:hypothetical protein
VAHASLNETAPSPPDTTTLDLAIGAAWLVALAAGLRVVEVLLGPSPLAVAIVGAVVVDLALARAGVRWDEVGGRPAAALARDAAVGAAVGALAVAVPVALLAIVGLARLAPGSPSIVALGLAAARAVGLAVRDELLFRGLVIGVAARAGLPPAAGLGFAALAGGASVALERGASAASVTLVVASGLLFAALWRRGRGAFQAVGAHAAFTLLAGAGLRGGALEVTWSSGLLAPGVRAQGAPAWAAAAVCAGLALVVASAARRTGAARVRGPGGAPRA